jgi:DNA-binding MarR family transcriptional regulator
MGLVQRSRDPADERSVRIKLTPVGCDMRRKEQIVHDGLMSTCGHTVEELREITAQLIRVRDILDAAAERRAAPAEETV